MHLYFRSTIRKQDIQFGIDKRNKAFGDIVGVPKVSTEVQGGPKVGQRKRFQFSFPRNLGNISCNRNGNSNRNSTISLFSDFLSNLSKSKNLVKRSFADSEKNAP